MSEHPESRPESGPSGGERRQAEAGTAPGLRWLYGELPGLVEARVLDDATALRLRQHYGELQPPRSSQRVLLGLFGLLGTLLIGGGIILLLAYNWEGMSRPIIWIGSERSETHCLMMTNCW